MLITENKRFKVGDYVNIIDPAGIHTLEINKSYKVIQKYIIMNNLFLLKVLKMEILYSTINFLIQEDLQKISKL